MDPKKVQSVIKSQPHCTHPEWWAAGIWRHDTQTIMWSTGALLVRPRSGDMIITRKHSSGSKNETDVHFLHLMPLYSKDSFRHLEYVVRNPTIIQHPLGCVRKLSLLVFFSQQCASFLSYFVTVSRLWCMNLYKEYIHNISVTANLTHRSSLKQRIFDFTYCSSETPKQSWVQSELLVLLMKADPVRSDWDEEQMESKLYSILSHTC